MLSAHPFQQQLDFPKNTVQGQLQGPFRGPVERMDIIYQLFTAALVLTRWCSGTFQLDDMDESDRCRNEDVEGGGLLMVLMGWFAVSWMMHW